MKPTKHKALLFFIRIEAKLWLRFHAPQANFVEKSTSALQMCFFWHELTKRMPLFFPINCN